MDRLIEALRAAVGPDHVLTDPAAVSPFATDWRKRYRGRPLAVVRPRATTEVAAVVRLCAAAGAAMVPQGGNTGLCGGATPDDSGREILISLSRMNRIRSIDLDNNTLTAEAGCVLAQLQTAATEADRLFPLSLASEGSCEIGGNLSTNAGGTAVLRYGNARELTLGLEVVLPSGEVMDALRGLRKDNTGYDLKHLFIGAEGTLGIITAAVLKLYPRPVGRLTAVAAVDTPRAAVALFGFLRDRCGERLSACELFSDLCLSLVMKHFPGCSAPFRERYPQYVLLELSDTREAAEVRAAAEAALGEALEKGLARDVVLAASDAQSRSLWQLRENISEAQAHEGQNVKHDVAVPASAIAAFIESAGEAVSASFPGAQQVVFGHLGDGNLHYNIAPPAGADQNAWLVNMPAINRRVHDLAAHFEGSMSAEHGIGRLKRDELHHYKSAVEIALMRSIKRAVDPQGLMNPGKVL